MNLREGWFTAVAGTPVLAQGVGQATLRLEPVFRASAGRYTCTGDNGFPGQLAEAEVLLQVQCE